MSGPCGFPGGAMRNLSRLTSTLAALPAPHGCRCLTVDSATAQVYALSSDGRLTCVDAGGKPAKVRGCSRASRRGCAPTAPPAVRPAAPVRPQSVWDIALGGGHTWLDATYVPALDGVCCVASSGAVVVVASEAPGEELVGDFTCGLLAACWSPDLEIVAFVNGDGAMLTMTTQWKVSPPHTHTHTHVHMPTQACVCGD